MDARPHEHAPDMGKHEQGHAGGEDAGQCSSPYARRRGRHGPQGLHRRGRGKQEGPEAALAPQAEAEEEAYRAQQTEHGQRKIEGQAFRRLHHQRQGAERRAEPEAGHTVHTDEGLPVVAGVGQRIDAFLFRPYALPAQSVGRKPHLNARRKLIPKVQPQRPGPLMRHVVQRKVKPELAAFPQKRLPVERLELAEAGDGLVEAEGFAVRQHGEHGQEFDLHGVGLLVFHLHGGLRRCRLIFRTKRHLLGHIADRGVLGKNVFPGRKRRFDDDTGLGRLGERRVSSGKLRLPFRRAAWQFAAFRRVQQRRRGAQEAEQDKGADQAEGAEIGHGSDAVRLADAIANRLACRVKGAGIEFHNALPEGKGLVPAARLFKEPRAMHQRRKEVGLELQRFAIGAESGFVSAVGFELYPGIRNEFMDDSVQVRTVVQGEMGDAGKDGVPEGHSLFGLLHVQQKGHALVEHRVGMVRLQGNGLFVIVHRLGALPLHAVHGTKVGDDIRVARGQRQ